MSGDSAPGPLARPADYGWSEWRPRVWHGMTMAPYAGLLSGNLARIAPRRWPLALSVAAAAAGNSALAAMARTRVGAAAPMRDDPVVILGFWRSGTTFLHELLAADPRHVAPDNLACLAPALFPLLRPFAGLLGRLLPATRPMDKVPLAPDFPQEDEFAILNLGLATPYRYMAFPSRGSGEAAQAAYWPAPGEATAEWRRRWLAFLAAVSAEAPGRRLVLKSPPHLARIRTILDAFPAARFVHIAREPLALFRSNVKMHRAMGATQTFERRLQNDADTGDGVIAMHRRLYDAFVRDLPSIPHGRLAELRYEDFMADPQARLERLYGELDLGDFSPARSAVRDLAQRRRGHRADNYEPDIELADRLHRDWERYCRAYGYARTGVAADFEGLAGR